MTNVLDALKDGLPPYQTTFPHSEFSTRRQRVAEAIGTDAVAIIQGAANDGGFDKFRQTNEMFYLSGVEVPQAHLLIDGKSGRSTLYLQRRDEKLERMDGPQLNCDRAEAVIFLTGVDAVRPLEALDADLCAAKKIVTPFSPAEGRMASRDTLLHAGKQRKDDPLEEPLSREERLRARLKERAPLAEVTDLSPLLDRLRLVKSPREVQVMRRAGQMTALAIREAMRATQSEIFEYQVAAVADYVFQLNGGRAGGAYRPIAASGKNIWNGHYFQNSAQLNENDWILLDFAPDFANYTSDIGRYWPVSGTYAPWQRELYGFIVTYHKTLLALIRPGVMASQIMDEAAARMESVVRSTRWSRPSFEKAARETLKFRGHLSHSVGMAVHDVGDYRTEPLKPGTVFALDPQMWVREDELYVRVEDTVVVTEDGVDVLTTGAPLELDDVEALMRDSGRAQWIAPADFSSTDRTALMSAQVRQ